MSVNRGKQFEGVIRDAFLEVSDTSVLRLPDQTNGFKGSTNPCDFIVYHYPLQYYIECKSTHGRRFPLNRITKNQRDSLMKAKMCRGIVAGVILWYIDYDMTYFIDIDYVLEAMGSGVKSLPYDINKEHSKLIKMVPGKKKRVFFRYDMEKLFDMIEDEYYHFKC